MLTCWLALTIVRQVHWLVFDGDVDPEWVENLNSLLDDNKLLTLPNGERLALPDNVRILFEVDSLRFATQATVSRCGMIWFSGAVVTPAMTAARFLARLAALSLDPAEAAAQRQALADQKTGSASGASGSVPPGLALQRECHAVLAPLLGTAEEEGPLLRVLRQAASWRHVMEVRRKRAHLFRPVSRFFFSGEQPRFASVFVVLTVRWQVSEAQLFGTLTTLVNGTIQAMQQRNAARPELPLSGEQIRGHLRRALCSHMQWAFGGSLLAAADRARLEQQIGACMAGEELPRPLEEHYAHLEVRRAKSVRVI